MKSYSCVVKNSDVSKIEADLQEKGFEFKELQYAHFHAWSKSLNVNISVYHSLKCLVQGKGTEDFVRFYLEPQILKTFDLDYGDLKFEDKIGMDESGKGDYFGPLVVAAAYIRKDQYKFFKNHGVMDSKNIDDKRIHVIADLISKNAKYKTVIINPEKYNQIYSQFNNLNNMLSWAHATCLKNLLLECDAKLALCDKFSSGVILDKYVNDMKLNVKLDQRIKGESDLAVAAASVIARSVFLNKLKYLSETYKVELPKGGGSQTLEPAQKFIKTYGLNNLNKIAKLHFKNTQAISN